MPQKIRRESSYDGQVVTLTLDAPKANILDAELMCQLQLELDDLREHAELKLVQFTGAGDHFSFGASVAEHTREKAAAMLTQFHALFHALTELAVPTAALISGQCLGGAMELALMCNFMFIDRTARLGQPEIVLGVFPPPASLLLPLKIGQARADELILTGRSLTAEEVVSFGLATASCADRAALEAGVEAWAAKHILPKSATALRYAVRASRWRFNQAIKTELNRLQEYYVGELMATHDANEGIAAFLEKRPPVWQNR
ncbi:enoyl-CoA hydratase/isomerase family protein [candidate division KSB1 bacterium]|nr:enoyl-CoA hydratase/isomerase family protein [candidate division KSB1 bacterium]